MKVNPKFIYIETYGCSANQNNTEIMSGLCKQAGLEITNNEKIADILVINTCIVKGRTENKIKRRIQDMLDTGKPVIVAGCMTGVRERWLESLKNKNLYVLGVHHVKEIVKLLKDIAEDNYENKKYICEKNEVKLCSPKIPYRREVGITQIGEGCVGNCTFCITRLAKGKLFSYPQEKIIRNVKNDVQAGCREIWITSQDNAAYGLDNGRAQLPELISKILGLKGRFKLRIGMMNPDNVPPILENLIEIYKNKKMQKFLHIPLQSGSDKVLKLMNRKYTIKDFLGIIGKFKTEIPDLVLSTDIIVGFPGESEEDFKETIEIIEKIKPEILNISRYWAMEGTPAAKKNQIDIKIIKGRAGKLQEIYKKSRNIK